MKNKIAMFCNVDPECVIDNVTVKTLYEIPLMLEAGGLGNIVCRRLGLICGEPQLAEWVELVENIRACSDTVKIALVGKYVKLHDAYLSVAESLFHGGIANGLHVEIEWVDSENLTPDNLDEYLTGCHGILVPGGFGNRGIEGKILAVQYARENRVPFFGICLGMQMAVVEYARNVLGLEANSAEFDENTPNPVIDIMEDQKTITAKGGTMRLGLYPCVVIPGTKMEQAYHKELIQERHRHRYELNNAYRDKLQAAGLVLSGISPDKRLVEAIELPDHPWFVAVQYHPEFLSRPNRAHPLFREFIRAAGIKAKESDK